MRHAVGFRRALSLCAVAAVAAGLLLLAPERACADTKEKRTQIRKVVWEQLFEVLAQNKVYVHSPDLSDPKKRQEFIDHPNWYAVRARYGRAEAREHYAVEKWQDSGDGRGPLGMVRAGSTSWGRPASVHFELVWYERAPDPPPTSSRDRPTKVGYRVDFKPIAALPTGKKGKALLDSFSRLKVGQVTTESRVTERTYAGLTGSARVVTDRGLVPGRPVAAFGISSLNQLFKLGQVSATFYDRAAEGVRLDYVDLRAVHRSALGWATLRLEVVTNNRAAQRVPELEPSEDQIHALMEAFARAYVNAAGAQSGAGALRILDANPIYTGGKSVEDLSTPEELQRHVTQERKAVAADGVTRVVLEVELAEPGVLRLAVPDAKASDVDQGQVEMLFGGRAVPSGEGDEKRLVAYALYTAPASFVEPRRKIDERGALPSERTQFGVATRPVPLLVSTGANLATLQPTSSPVEVPLVRPPVILVHGTFDTPEECWDGHARELEPAAGSVSMATALRQAGYAVFKLDFSKTNGSPSNPESSSLRHNARVLWENPRGLHNALQTCRDEMEIAVTQADVVGHSLGGLIARLWVSEAYNPASETRSRPFDAEGTSGYRRVGNFGQGDIHRLVTIATPHAGADLGHLGLALKEAPLASMVTVREWLRGPVEGVNASAQRIARKALEGIAFAGARVFKGYGITPIVEDQLPHLESMPNDKLVLIGPTRVASHAIVCAARIPDVATFGGDYRRFLKLAAWWMLNARPETVKAFFAQRGQAQDLDRIFGEVIDMDRREREDGEPPGAWLLDGGHAIAPRDNYTLYALGRSILFGNTQNDMVVRVESQRGGLPLQYRTFINGVLHSFAARYERVQRAVVEALTGPAWRFSPEGFPAPAPLRNIQPFDVAQDAAVRAEAVAESNIVPSHAQSLSYVAKQENIIILMRPVNEHATALIARNMATKDMHVKGKSANWGPQRGFIAVQQRFSKLHFAAPPKRGEKIKKFDGKVQDCLRDNRARETALQISIRGKPHDVLIVKGDDLEPPQAIVLRNGNGDIKGWESGGAMIFDPEAALPPPRLSAEEITRRGTQPLTVLSDRHTRVPLTADYDILAFGPTFSPGDAESDPEMGFVIEWQKALIHKMNNEIRLRGNYAGGNVSHHGPETQFTFSEGADYPISVFEPDGDIWIVESGPDGRRDLHLKRYFHVMRAQGWQLAPNLHTWNWGEYDPKKWPSTGWRAEDDLQISAALKEDNPYDSDEGDEAVAPSAGGR